MKPEASSAFFQRVNMNKYIVDHSLSRMKQRVDMSRHIDLICSPETTAQTRSTRDMFRSDVRLSGGAIAQTAQPIGQFSCCSNLDV